MNRGQRIKSALKSVQHLSNFTVRVLSTGHINLNQHQWLLPESKSLFWSIYIPENEGLLLGSGEEAKEVPVGSIGLVPPHASAMRDNTGNMNCVYLHFDLGGYVSIEMESQLSEISVVSAEKFHALAAKVKQDAEAQDTLVLQLNAQVLLSGVLAEAVFESHKPRLKRSVDDPLVQQILPMICAVEERLNCPKYQVLKIRDMAAMCGLKPVVFSRIFFEATGVNPSEYVLNRRIAVAAQHLLFTTKSIDEITSAFAFANRFYFSQVFKNAVGVTPAAYRSDYYNRGHL